MNQLELLYQIFEVCIIPLLGVLTAYIVQLIKAKTNEVNMKNDNELLIKYTNMLSATITKCVIATNQTYVDTLKKQGAFNAEAQKLAFNLTYDAVMLILSDEAKDYLTNIYGDLNTYIINQIEATVKENK